MGAFLFGLDIRKGTEELKKATDEIKLARVDAEKTIKDLSKTKKQLQLNLDEMSVKRRQFSEFIDKEKNEIQAIVDGTKQQSVTIQVYITESMNRSKRLLEQMGLNGDKGATTVAIAVGESNGAQPPLGRTFQLALVADSDISELKFVDLRRAAEVFQKQITRDLRPVGNVDATVVAYESVDKIPEGTWPIFIKKEAPRIPSG